MGMDNIACRDMFIAGDVELHLHFMRENTLNLP